MCFLELFQGMGEGWWAVERTCTFGKHVPWLDFFTKLQKFTSFAYSWSTSEEYKILDAVVSNELLAANANANVGSYQIKEYKNSSLGVHKNLGE